MGYIEKSDYESAAADLNTGIKRDPQLPLCYFARSDLHFSGAEYQKAVDDLTKALYLRPGSAAMLMKRGKAYEHLGEEDKALADFKAAAAIVPSSKKIQDAIERLSKDSKS